MKNKFFKLFKLLNYKNPKVFHEIFRRYAPQDKFNQQAFTLIEVLVGIFILAISVVTIYSMFNMSLKVIWESKARISATALANQKLEMARNLPFDDIGTLGGIPAGQIPQSEIVTRNSIDFTIDTEVLYIDDPFDGIQGGDPDDLLPTDYKRVRVEVGWSSRYGDENLIFLTDIAPKGIETAEGGGTIKINVFNSIGEAVPQANVHIVNNDVIPAVDLTTQTNNNGVVYIPGSPASVENYLITVTKNGYSSDYTNEATAELPSPDKPPLTVFEGAVTSSSFQIDLVSNLTIYTYDINEVSLPYIDVNITGTKTIGKNADEEYVYKYDQTLTSNTSGQIVLTDIEWDSYTFTLDESEPYNIAEFSPPEPLDIYPNTSREMILKLVPQADHSVMIIVKNINSDPVAEALVRLYNLSEGIDESATTTDVGTAFFSPWIEATSTLEVSKTGYNNYQDELDISGYYTEEVILSQE